jgi:hypothetical protein
MLPPELAIYGQDHEDLTGMLSLYLDTPRADPFRGCFVSVNWDVRDLEANQDRIRNEGLLKLNLLPILPVFGGKGL